ncbi:MAG: hypothetical protein R3Y06_06985 [Faecalibacterium sp.]
MNGKIKQSDYWKIEESGEKMRVLREKVAILQYDFQPETHEKARLDK